jgi:hypothetical protein
MKRTSLILVATLALAEASSGSISVVRIQGHKIPQDSEKPEGILIFVIEPMRERGRYQ